MINKTNISTNYILKLIDITTGQALTKDTVKYSLIKDGINKMNLVSTIKNEQIDKGTIQGNQTIHYSLRLWIASGIENDALINKKSLSFRIEVEILQEIEGEETSSEKLNIKAFNHENIGSSCHLNETDETSLLTGDCKHNYVWYSGKLWRIVSKDKNTEATKLITENNITTLVYSTNNSTLDGSQIDEWMNHEFLETLHDYENYIMLDSKWDISSRTATEKQYLTRAIGTLIIDDYYASFSEVENESSYLINGTEW